MGTLALREKTKPNKKPRRLTDKQQENLVNRFGLPNFKSLTEANIGICEYLRASSGVKTFADICKSIKGVFGYDAERDKLLFYFLPNGGNIDGRFMNLSGFKCEFREWHKGTTAGNFDYLCIIKVLPKDEYRINGMFSW